MWVTLKSLTRDKAVPLEFRFIWNLHMLESKYGGTISLTYIQCTTPDSGFEPSPFIPSSHTDSPSFPGNNKQQQQLCKNKRLYQLCDPPKNMSQAYGEIYNGEENLLCQLKPDFSQ